MYGLVVSVYRTPEMIKNILLHKASVLRIHFDGFTSPALNLDEFERAKCVMW